MAQGHSLPRDRRTRGAALGDRPRSATPARARSASGTRRSASTSPTPTSARGLYPAPLPAGMGVEGAGVVEAVGPGVAGFAEGDRVTYTGSPLGAYSTERVMPVDSPDQAARRDPVRDRRRDDDARPDDGVPAAPHRAASPRATPCCCTPRPAASG